MLDPKTVHECLSEVRKSIQARRLNPDVANVDQFLKIDEDWKTTQGECDRLRQRRNELSNAVKQAANPAERQERVEEVRLLKSQLAESEEKAERLHAKRLELLQAIPNLLANDVPEGASDDDNQEISRWGTPRELAFDAIDHLTLGKLTDTIDFERGAAVAGAGFYYLKNEAVLLEQALLAFCVNRAVAHGFTPVATPDVARASILDGIGFSPRGSEKQVYRLDVGDLCLVGTAEITLGGYHSGEILDSAVLPKRYIGLSHCFRTEAGAYGKESRGLYRVHQFSKAELFVLCEPEQSPSEHEFLRKIEEELLQELKIPYRVVNVCSGELGAPAAKKYDIEAWMPSRKTYGEVTSCSNCTDYQARRLNIRFRETPKAPTRFVHMLNGTAVAVSRTLIAIYENYQQQDGTILVPDALKPFVNLTAIPRRA